MNTEGQKRNNSSILNTLFKNCSVCE